MTRSPGETILTLSVLNPVGRKIEKALAPVPRLETLDGKTRELFD